MANLYTTYMEGGGVEPEVGANLNINNITFIV